TAMIVEIGLNMEVILPPVNLAPGDHVYRGVMTKRVVLAAFLLAATPMSLAAQQRPVPARPAQSTERAAEPTPVEEGNAGETRDRLRQIMDQYPPSVSQVLRLDPSLINRPDYMSSYPTLAAFLAQHPEVPHNPAFFLGAPGGGPQYRDTRAQVASAVE